MDISERTKLTDILCDMRHEMNGLVLLRSHIAQRYKDNMKHVLINIDDALKIVKNEKK